MALGTVKWFDTKKGFGFIRPDLGSIDVFVHISALKSSGLSDLAEDQRVEFELVQLNDGRVSAFGIHVVASRPPSPKDGAASQNSGRKNGDTEPPLPR
ncbi:cold-shock protein [Pacificimonas flava]|uniref:Cold-shock protein n=2 Tax=Pacificimonas TaxID=1960290 RepID=A0A219B832_9SPHN|nr:MULTISPECIES: cold-shock protein [Pacificimonas]MBZ6378337.1 cold-shock protein [Pacificimonas aurantium]OWV34550.1 cold-shock protein [Pacificimonas flava]